MRIAVTGSRGQVALSLVERAAARGDVEVVAIGRPEIDLARPETLKGCLGAVAPDILVSAAAYTAVDQAEDEPDLAMAVNGIAPGLVAAEAAAAGIPVIHLSTDYVFSGEGDKPYREDDATGPKGVYGRTKLAGEKAVAAANPRHVVLRTAWVYSPFGKNFVRTMLRLAAERDTVSVVADQWGNPTSALDIADGILAVADRLAAGTAPFGVYHLAGTGFASWADLARCVFAESGARGGPVAEVRGIATADYPTRASRPANSRLDTARLRRDFGWSAPPWQRSAAHVVDRLLSGDG